MLLASFLVQLKNDTDDNGRYAHADGDSKCYGKRGFRDGKKRTFIVVKQIVQSIVERASRDNGNGTWKKEYQRRGVQNPCQCFGIQ